MSTNPTIVDDEPTNEYGRGFLHGHRAGYASGRASRAAEIEQYRRRIHELDQENHQLRRIIGRTVEPLPDPAEELAKVRAAELSTEPTADALQRLGVISHG